jgi:hypothetical protein
MKRICLSICILIGVASNLFGTDLRDVLAHPEKYENRRITVVGIARVPGYFYLCADKKAATDRHPEKALLVRKDNSIQPEYREMDRKWVQVTGVLSDKKRDGYELIPRDFAGHGICMEDIRILRDRPQLRIKDDTVWVVFKNNTSVALEVDHVAAPKVGEVSFLGPHETEKTQISEGRASAFRLKGPANLPLHKQQAGERIATGDI